MVGQPKNDIFPKCVHALHDLRQNPELSFKTTHVHQHTIPRVQLLQMLQNRHSVINKTAAKLDEDQLHNFIILSQLFPPTYLDHTKQKSFDDLPECQAKTLTFAQKERLQAFRHSKKVFSHLKQCNALQDSLLQSFTDRTKHILQYATHTKNKDALLQLNELELYLKAYLAHIIQCLMNEVCHTDTIVLEELQLYSNITTKFNAILESSLPNLVQVAKMPAMPNIPDNIKISAINGQEVLELSYYSVESTFDCSAKLKKHQSNVTVHNSHEHSDIDLNPIAEILHLALNETSTALEPIYNTDPDLKTEHLVSTKQHLFINLLKQVFSFTTHSGGLFGRHDIFDIVLNQNSAQTLNLSVLILNFINYELVHNSAVPQCFSPELLQRLEETTAGLLAIHNRQLSRTLEHIPPDETLFHLSINTGSSYIPDSKTTIRLKINETTAISSSDLHELDTTTDDTKEKLLTALQTSCTSLGLNIHSPVIAHKISETVKKWMDKDTKKHIMTISKKDFYDSLNDEETLTEESKQNILTATCIPFYLHNNSIFGNPCYNFTNMDMPSYQNLHNKIFILLYKELGNLKQKLYKIQNEAYKHKILAKIDSLEFMMNCYIVQFVNSMSDNQCLNNEATLADTMSSALQLFTSVLQSHATPIQHLINEIETFDSILSLQNSLDEIDIWNGLFTDDSVQPTTQQHLTNLYNVHEQPEYEELPSVKNTSESRATTIPQSLKYAKSALAIPIHKTY